ncbi:restriction endonuclease subunit M [Helicobacter pylori]|nr:restriction endonuclease subunit M [Helicobacter pylori]
MIIAYLPHKRTENARNKNNILFGMLVSVSKSHRKGLENYGKDIKT